MIGPTFQNSFEIFLLNFKADALRINYDEIRNGHTTSSVSGSAVILQPCLGALSVSESVGTTLYHKFVLLIVCNVGSLLIELKFALTVSFV